MPTRYQNGPGIDNKLSTHIVGSSPPNYHLQDHLGTTFGTTNNSGAFSSAGISDSFGSPGGIDFTGREYDSFNELYYYRARMYDPTIGRFISEDPIGFGGGDINLYGYVWNNPLHFTDPFGLDGWGNDFADWLDGNIDYAHNFYRSQDVQNWQWNGGVDTVRDLASGTSDMFRVGSGTGYALFAEDENGWGRAAFVAMDIARAAGLASAMGFLGARFANSPTGGALNSRIVACFPGKEFKFKSGTRIAPFGNRTGHPTGEKPHYHRQRLDKKGRVERGKGKRRHRPWDTSPEDTSFLDRF